MSTPTLEEEVGAADALIRSLQSEDEHQQRDSRLREAPSTEVTLPGGFYDIDGSVYKTAQVRELTGRDEEAIGREAKKAAEKGSYGKILLMLLERGVVQIGDEENTSEALDLVYMADWDALLIGIYTATFGDTVDWRFQCTECLEEVDVEVDLKNDVEIKTLRDEDRLFTVQGRRSEYRVALPTGETARKAFLTDFKSIADFNTCLIAGGVREIDGVEIMTLDPIQNMPLADRKKVQDEIQKRVPSVKMEAVKTTCPACEEKQMLIIPLAALFRSQGVGL